MAAGIAMAEVVETMVGQAAPSVLADEMMCPALRESPPAHGPRGPRVHAGPCLDDAKCAAVMAASSGRLYRCVVSAGRLQWPVPRCTALCSTRAQYYALLCAHAYLHYVLTRCTALCRARAPRSPHRTLPGQEGDGGGGDRADRGDDGNDMVGESSDPYFSGGYGRDPANQRWGGR
eukprot:scaffold26902_cov65-Phaeocystis_antarctica.AAC.3